MQRIFWAKQAQYVHVSIKARDCRITESADGTWTCNYNCLGLPKPTGDLYHNLHVKRIRVVQIFDNSLHNYCVYRYLALGIRINQMEWQRSLQCAEERNTLAISAW